MRFSRRTFLFSFVPFAVLLSIGFWAIQRVTVDSVRSELRESLRRQQAETARLRAQGEAQNVRFLSLMGDNSSLKAAVQLVLAERKSAEARTTVEDELGEICSSLRLDFLAALDSNGAVLAAVERHDNYFEAMKLEDARLPVRGLFVFGGVLYHVNAVDLAQAGEHLGTVAVGERFGMPEDSALIAGGKAVRWNFAGATADQLAGGMSQCAGECELRANGQTFLTSPMKGASLGEGYELRSIVNLDAAAGPAVTRLQRLFAGAGIAGLILATVLSAVSTRSIVKPIATIVERLRESARNGEAPEFTAERTAVVEIRELMAAFNRSARALRKGEDDLKRAYFEFVHALAGALDARDPYTAGHSRRVSEYSCQVAAKFGFTEREMETIRIGALLHDIGKIGVSDVVLRKPGRLTDEERKLIEEHPTIGRKILEEVSGFEQYLPAVELHHENWDGTGYPHRLAGEAVPMDARIVHVADAYDAMTSDRPYRPGMSREEAFRRLQSAAGTQFDPAIVRVFLETIPDGDSLSRLAEAVGAAAQVPAVRL